MLSHLLIAYTYDFNSALERLEDSRSPQLPSLAMFANVLQFVPNEGIGEKQLRSLCGVARPTLQTMLDCLKRHGWISIRDDGLVRLTPRGSGVVRAFPDANEAVEREWEAHLGTDIIATLRRALEAACTRLPRDSTQYPVTAAHRGAFPKGE
jgi:predicted transcriptional regulator